jgi:hypothetical protein
MTSYDQALMECELEYRPVELFCYKAGMLVRIV